MRMISLELESKLRGIGLWPRNRTAWAALYVLALDLLLFAAQWLTHLASPNTAETLEGWIVFLSALAIVLFISVGFRWLRSKLLWRLRNRLIVTYVFIGVIPVFLLLVISLTTLYLLAGQFASFVVTSDIATHLHSLESANRAIAHHLATGISTTGKVDANILSRARPNRPEWSTRQVCAWYRNQTQPYCSTTSGAIADSPASLTGDFREIIRDHDTLFLRTGTTITLGQDPLRVVLSEPLDQEFLAKIAADLGRIVVYDESPSSIMIERQGAAKTGAARTGAAKTDPALPDPKHTFSSGTMPLAANALDPIVRFPIPLQVVDWATGERHRAGALAEVETRP